MHAGFHMKIVLLRLLGERRFIQFKIWIHASLSPGAKNPLNMVVIKGFGDKPMMLLTSLKITSNEKDLWFIISSYLKRWSIEETIRFIKQTYELENIRVLKYVRLKNMMALLLAVFYFVAIILDQSQKLTVMAGHVLKWAKRVFGIPDFKYYALGDGLIKYFLHVSGKTN